jgi:hypothetical protein
MVKDLVALKGKAPKVPDKPESYANTFDKNTVQVTPEREPEATKLYDSWKTLAHKLGLTQDQFSGLISANEKMIQENVKKQAEAFQTSEAGLKDEWKDKYDANLTSAEKVVSELFDDDFRKFLTDSGLANNPRFVKAMYNLSQSVSEDTFVRSQARGTPKQTRDPKTGQVMLSYPSMTKK